MMNERENEQPVDGAVIYGFDPGRGNDRSVTVVMEWDDEQKAWVLIGVQEQAKRTDLDD